MTEADLKADLHRYLQEAREALLWKLDGLSEYDIRRPLTPTGTNLLGLVKHLTTVELLYLGYVFDRHFDEPVSWLGHHAEANVDMWATADQSREYIVGLYRRAWKHSDATIQALGLDTVGHVEWWAPEYGKATLHRVLVHIIAETHRHIGHADIVRELIDGVVGTREGDGGIASGDQARWEDYRNRLERVAQEVGRS
ncbi:DinB family protein [Microtetraspora malaysiensis]|uniref:DinB family protein n=1 Tax=Microtetraspora malaysiensis TaxID=161358 RepID=UPI000836F1A1|nr:DinB family protein [Microtetraspora malaysiensis]